MEWTVKYAPKSLNDLVGNKNNYTKLINWLTNYYKIKKSARGKDFKFISLLVGPPGIGKTSGINAIARELNFEIIEFNASDQRNEKVISHLVGRETKTHVNPGYNGKIVLLDEVDGIQGREDKGGLSALMRLAKDSVHPIICTANDPQSDKIRSLKKSPMTITLSFVKPSTDEMAVLLTNIAKRESITVPPKLIKIICDNSRGDIRGAVNDLENLSQERQDIPMNAIQALSIRDSEVSIDLALRQIFGEAKTPRQAHEVTSDLDVDYSMFMQYIVENIPSHSKKPGELESMYSSAALADLFYGRIMTTQHWKYLKYYFYFLSAGVWASKVSPYQQHYPKFPSAIMMLSRTKKVRAVRNSVTLKFGKLTHSSKHKVTNFSLPYIRLFFEELFQIYTNKQLDEPKAQQLLEIVADIHNEISLDEDEFIYLFNDPLYEKQTAAEEKKQKQLMKIIDEKALDIRKNKIVSHNIELNKLLQFKAPEKEKSSKLNESTMNQPASQVEDKKTMPETLKTAKKKKTTKQREKDIPGPSKVDTFDQEEVKPAKAPDKKKTLTESVNEKKTSKEGSSKGKDKQKGLLDFADAKNEDKEKKKKGSSKKLLEFM